MYKPRHDSSHWQVFGRDILTDDLHSIPAWRFIDSWWQQNLPLFPLTGGEVITGVDAAQRLKAAIDSLGIQRVNRRSLLIPDGLTHSYVWCKANRWVQEVADPDVSVLRTTPMLNQCFRSAAHADNPVTPRTYEYGGTERHAFTSFDDLERFRRETAP